MTYFQLFIHLCINALLRNKFPVSHVTCTSKLSIASWTAIGGGGVHGVVAQPHHLTGGRPTPGTTVTGTTPPRQITLTTQIYTEFNT